MALTKRVTDLENYVTDTVIDIKNYMAVMKSIVVTVIGRLTRSEICYARILNELSDVLLTEVYY